MRRIIYNNKNGLLILGILLHAISYFIPFLTGIVGWRFYGEGIKAFISNGLGTHWYLYYFFFMPVISRWTEFLICFAVSNFSSRQGKKHSRSRSYGAYF